MPEPNHVAERVGATRPGGLEGAPVLPDVPDLPSPASPASPWVHRPGGGTAPRRPPPVTALLTSARAGLDEAVALSAPGERYGAAHLAALRGAAAVLAARARPAVTGSRRSRPSSAWALLAALAPELGEWAAFFAAGAGKRAAADAGLAAAVTTREADDLVRDAAAFLATVEASLGWVHQPVLHAAVG